MDPIAFRAAIEDRLRPLADPAQAVPMRAYLLDKFSFLGLPAPLRRAAVKDLVTRPVPDADRLLASAALLWELEEREFRYTAIDLLRQQHRLLRPAHLPAIRTLLLAQPWWETVDGLGAVVGRIVHGATKHDPDAQRTMDEWLAHPDFWVRRTAMLHQLGWRLETDQARLGAYARQLAHEQEFFIRKAVGWALRDYARWNPGFVRDFVRAHRSELSNLSLREACKHLDPAADASVCAA